jgi:hypothetical protein
MPKGISLHIGLNQVDPNYYNGWNGGPLAGCINDARDMKTVADASGYQSTMLTDSQATASAVTKTIGQIAQQLDSGDIFLITYSGHGGQINDVNGDDSDGLDETWVLWDRELLDDELYQLWAQFRSGVRIFVLSDSCHSGTVTRRRSLLTDLYSSDQFTNEYGVNLNGGPNFRVIPPQVQEAVIERDRNMYEALMQAARSKPAIGASVLSISGCQDNQLSLDGARNGLFTGTLLQVWNSGSFSGNYRTFHREIVNRMPPTQTPQYYLVGAVNTTFEAERPFTIGGTMGGGTAIPNIQGPASLQYIDQLPILAVNPGANRYYAVEVATSPALFDYEANGDRRNDDNFFGSWRTIPFGFAPSYPTSYNLPAQVWDRLRRNTKHLYYRLWATDSPNRWVNQVTTTPDARAATAPFIRIVSTIGRKPGLPLKHKPSVDETDNTSHQLEENMNNEVTGNLDSVLSELTKRAQSLNNTEALEQAIATNSQAAQFAFFGLPGSAIPFATTPTVSAATAPATSDIMAPRPAVRGGTVVRTFWWGFHIQISHEDLNTFLNSFEPINAVIGAIGGGIPSPAAPWIALAAAFIAGALQLLRTLDKGRGVYVSMLWWAPGVFVPTTV